MYDKVKSHVILSVWRKIIQPTRKKEHYNKNKTNYIMISNFTLIHAFFLGCFPQSAEPVTQKEDKIKVMLQRTLSKELTTLLTEESLVDLVVIVEGQRFPCHGVVLASFSGYFRSMLISQWKERTSREVTLDSGNVTKEVFF